MLSLFTKAQIGNWSDCAWWDPEYDKLYEEQAQTIDPAKRKTLIDRMQQIVYEQSPYSVLAYPKGLEAENVADWEGWVQSPSGTGSAIYSVDNIDSYLYVHPRAGAATGGAGDDGSRSTLGYTLVAVGVAAVAVGVVLTLVRRGRRRMEE